MRTKLGGLLIAVLCAVCLTFACGGGDDETYTEKKLIEESIDVYCDRLNECDKEAFDKKYSSLGDCVKAKKEDTDITPIGDDVFEYGAVCAVGYSFDPDMAKKTMDCLRSISCAAWSQSDACSEYETKVCIEDDVIDNGIPCAGEGTICDNLEKNKALRCQDGTWVLDDNCGEKDQVCKDGDCVVDEKIGDDCAGAGSACVGSKIIECSTERKWVETKDCATESMVCGETSSGAICSVSQGDACDGSVTFCSQGSFYWCDNNDWVNIDCAGQGKECDIEEGCVPGVSRRSETVVSK